MKLYPNGLAANSQQRGISVSGVQAISTKARVSRHLSGRNFDRIAFLTLIPVVMLMEMMA